MTRTKAFSLSIAGALFILVAAIMVGSFACERTGNNGQGGHGGQGGAGGCPIAPQAMLTITIRAIDGPVPPDTTVRVTWSAGEEPTFMLNDPATWKTLDDANLVCAVDRANPPPTDLEELVCELWTSGATQVEVFAQNYVSYDETLSPMSSEVCEGFVPTQFDIQLVRDMDAATP